MLRLEFWFSFLSASLGVETRKSDWVFFELVAIALAQRARRARHRERVRIEQERRREGEKRVCNSLLIIIFYLFPLLLRFATTLHTITSSIQCQLTFVVVFLLFSFRHRSAHNDQYCCGWNTRGENWTNQQSALLVNGKYKSSLVSDNLF